MFTGIVEELGIVARVGPRLEVACRTVAGDSGPGASVSVNGVCLTVVERRERENGPVLAFDLSPETLVRTALGRLQPGDPANLERPVTLLSRLGGHLVQGHVDGTGQVEGIEDAGPGKRMVVRIPEGLGRYVVEKGSIAVDGISLTVTEARDDLFAVAVVPYTLEATTLRSAHPGDRVNVEVDIVAKYIARLLSSAPSPVGERP